MSSQNVTAPTQPAAMSEAMTCSGVTSAASG